MKRILSCLLAAAFILALVPQQADAATARLYEAMATRSGPGTHYYELGGYGSTGDTVTVHTKVRDTVNEIWWVQVEFVHQGYAYRAYTGSWRMNVDLATVPQERAQRTCYVTGDADVFTGPGWEYMMWNDTVYSGTDATLYEVENGYGLIECYNRSKGAYWRVWIDLNLLSCGHLYGDGEDTYPERSSLVDSGYSSGANPGSGGYSTPSGGNDPYGLIGRTCIIAVAGSGRARSGPGVDYATAAYVYGGQEYYIYDTAVAQDNNRIWYKIRVDDVYCWISSGIATVDGRSDYTAPGGYSDATSSATANAPTASNSGDFRVGKQCVIASSSANARSGPGTNYAVVATVLQNERYYIYDTAAAQTNGRTWYKIEVNGAYCWISSGVAQVNGTFYD